MLGKGAETTVTHTVYHVPTADGGQVKPLGFGEPGLRLFPPPIVVEVLGASVTSSFQAAQAEMSSAGYVVTLVHWPKLPLTHHFIDDSHRTGFVLAERSIKRDAAATRLSQRAAAALVGIGVILGAILAVLSGDVSWLVFLPLTLGLPALLILSIWGTAYLEECVAVQVEVPADIASSPGASLDLPLPHRVSWFTGRVHSRIQSRKSAPSSRNIGSVEADQRLNQELAAMVAGFPRRGGVTTREDPLSP